MNRKPNLYWDEKIVMSYLIHAASIHRRLPEVKAKGYFTLWPPTLQDDWDRLYNALHGQTTLGSPMPPEVTFHEEVMAWLPYLNRHEQQLVWMRSNKVPWKILTVDFDRSKASLSRDLVAALSRLVVRLNRIDSDGHYYQRLQRRANGYLSHETL